MIAGRALVLLLLAAGTPSARWADADYEATIDSLLRARDPVAESLFVAAGQARQSNQLQLAMDLYARVLQRVPDFAPAERRLALVQLDKGDRYNALMRLYGLAQRDSSAFTLSAVANAIITTELELPREDLQNARHYAARAVVLMPRDPWVVMTAFRVGMRSGDLKLARASAEALVQIAPGDWQPWAALAFASARTDPSTAAGAFERARRLGMPQDAANHVEAVLLHESEQHRHTAWIWAGVWVLAGWLAVLGLLLVAGLVLSGATLRAAGRYLEDPDGRALGLDAWLRNTYRAVLWWCCAFWYVSMPIVTALVLGIGGGLIYLALRFGHIPIKLIALVAVLTFSSVLAVVRSLFVRGRDEDPGTRLDPAEAPRLRAVLDEVAARIGTRTVDVVYLTPSTEIAVMERGGLRAQLAGRSERCLILGVGVLDGMTVGQLKSILAHEYGHFSNRDTAGGGMALSVRRSLYTMAMHLAIRGAAGWFNPAWWFVRGFDAVFMRISQGASRLQEVLADRWAASVYGSTLFSSALTHVIETSVRFEAVAIAAVNESLKQKQPLPNLYQARPTLSSEQQTGLDEAVKQALDAEPSDLDSHPAPRQRMAWLERFAAHGEAAAAGDEQPAWSLLPEREGLERRMTRAVLASIEARHGVQFATGEPAPA